ncbi:unnamed protein product, partial [Prorocentrum cordatum]
VPLMAPWTCAWQCRCGQQNWNSSVNCVKCNGHWKSSKKESGTSNPKGRQRSKSQKSQRSASESRPWEDDLKSNGAPFVRMATPAETQAHPDYRPLSSRATESEKKEYYRETRSRLNLLQQRYNLAWAMREPVQELATSISILRRMLISEKSLHQQSAWAETTLARMMLRVEAANKEVISLKDQLQAKVNIRDNLQDQLDALKRTKKEIHQLMEEEKRQKELEASEDMDEDKPSQGVVVFLERTLEEIPAGTAPSSASIQHAVQQQVEAQLKPMADQMLQMQQPHLCASFTSAVTTDCSSQFTTIVDADAAVDADTEGGVHSAGHDRGTDFGEGAGCGFRERLRGPVLARAAPAWQPEDVSIAESKRSHPEGESARIFK